MSRTTRTERSASWKTSAGASVSATRFSSTSLSLNRYCSSRSKSARVAPWAAVRMIAPPPPRSSCLASLRSRSRSLSSRRRGHPHALAGRRVDHVAAGDRELHREPRALGLQRVLDDLDDDLLPRGQQVGDPCPGRPGAAPAADLLLARDDDLVDVQEAVLVEPDVDERGLEAGQHVVDLALVDVADDRPSAAALEVDLGDAVPGRDLGLLLTAAGGATSKALRGRPTPPAWRRGSRPGRP